jgi:hypothetical protein
VVLFALIFLRESGDWMRCNIGGLAIVLSIGYAGLVAACSSSGPAASPQREAGVDAAVDAPRAKDARADAKKESGAVDARIDATEAGCTRSGTCNACLATDPENCGSCGRSCGAGGTCAQGICTAVLASGQGSAPNVVDDLIIDSDTVYWIPATSGASNGAVLSVPKAGGAISTLASGIAQPEGLTQDATNLYFVSHDVGIERVAKTGGPRTTLLADGTLDGGVFPEFWLLLANRDLFYVGGMSTGIYDLSLDGVGTDGGGVPIPIATTAGVLGAPGTGYNALSVDDAGVYYDTTAQIIALNRATTQVATTVQGSSPTAGDRFGPTIAIDDLFIYYISNVQGDGGVVSSLMKSPKAGGAPTLITTTSVAFNDGPIFVNASNVYWSHLTDPAAMTSDVVGISKTGGAVQTIATGCYVNCPFAIDATSVYWPGNDGKIRRAPTPL